MLGSWPDLFRLVVVPVFAWAAWRDVKTRRLPNSTWLPLVGLGIGLLAWEVWAHLPIAGVNDRLFLVRVAASVGLVVPLSYVFWRLGGFGGADAKALMTLALVFPTYPVYYLPVAWLPSLPAVRTYVGVFSLTILTNTVLAGLAFPLALAARNAAVGDRSPVMFFGRRVPVGEIPRTYGRLFEDRDGFTRRGLDLDALRMYLRWRGLRLADLRATPDRYRDPASVDETHSPTDGAVHAGPSNAVGASDGCEAPDGGSVGGEGDDGAAVGDRDGAVVEERDGGAVVEERDGAAEAAEVSDPWAAERFLEEIDGTAYGTDPDTLREGLEVLTAEDDDEVWVSPGLPFVVPMFAGLVLALTYGDLLFGLLLAVGAV